MDRNLKNRKSIRLKNYDYSSNGAYFITLLMHERKSLLGQIIDGKMVHTKIGEIAYKNWLAIPRHFENINLDQFVIMPNHIHGIIIIESSERAEYILPQQIQPIKAGKDVREGYILPQRTNQFQQVTPKSISSIISTYKASVTRDTNKVGERNFKWQRSFYERVIRNQEELENIREYIVNNPLKWELDKNNPGSSRYIERGTIY